MKFACAVDMLFQTFLTKCMDVPSIAQVDPHVYDISFLTSMVQHQRFTGSLPPCLMQSSTPSCESPKNEIKKRKDPKTNEERSVVNKKKRLEQIIPETSRIGEVFNSEAIKCVPVFKDEAKVCVRFHSKGHCLSNCGLKASHVDLPAKVGDQYHTWQLKYRSD